MDELEKALEQIVRAFLLHETKAIPSNENESTNKADDLQKEGINDTAAPAAAPISVSIPINAVLQLPEDEFVTSLYQCLEERGVIREVHAFLRQRLVEILKGSVPYVVVSGCDGNFNLTVIKLLDDFLCCHKLLFTYSVLVTELDNKFPAKQDFNKLYSRDAETLLEDIGIRRNSEASRKILKLYSEKEYASLLECIIGVSSWGADNDNDNMKPWSFDSSTKMRDIENEYNEKIVGVNVPHLEGADERLFQLQLNMERDKEAQIRIAMAKFREEETGRIRDEISNRLKFEFVSKEKELLRNYDDRVKHMRHLLEREKEIWLIEKGRKEKELFEQRQDLIKLMEHVKQKKMKLKEALAEINQKQRDNNLEPTDSSGLQKVQNQTQFHANKEDEDSFCDSESISNPSPNLTKNIKLEETIARLNDENERLRKKLLKHTGVRVHKHKHSSKIPRQNSSTDNDCQSEEDQRNTLRRNFVENDHTDKIAFLQYAVEKQTAEVDMLKHKLQEIDCTEKTSHKSKDFRNTSEIEMEPLTQTTSNQNQDADLETFLAESKRRFADIEKSAEVVGSSLREVFKRKYGTGTINLSDSSLSRQIQGLGGGDIPPVVPKLPATLKKSSQPSMIPTQSLLAPRFMSTTSSSIDNVLKSFLINQTEDVYTSEKSNKIPESPHVARLKAANVSVKPAAQIQIIPSNSNLTTKTQQPKIVSSVTAISSSIVIPGEVAAGESSQYEIRRLSSDSTNKFTYGSEPIASTSKEGVTENKMELINNDDIVANNTPVVKVPKSSDEHETLSSVIVTAKKSPPTRKSSSDSPKQFPTPRLTELPKTSILPDNIVTQNLFSLPFLNPSDDTQDFNQTSGLMHTDAQIPAPQTVSSTTFSRDQTPPSNNESQIEPPPAPGVTQYAPDVESSALAQVRIPSHRSKATSNGNVKPTPESATSSGALTQYKVPSPETSERHDQPFKSTKVTHQELEMGTGDISDSSKPKLATARRISNGSETSLSYPDLTVSHADGNGDAFEMMAEEDFWAI